MVDRAFVPVEASSELKAHNLHQKGKRVAFARLTIAILVVFYTVIQITLHTQYVGSGKELHIEAKNHGGNDKKEKNSATSSIAGSQESTQQSRPTGAQVGLRNTSTTTRVPVNESPWREEYRLGDFIRFDTFRRSRLKAWSQRFPHSLASEYGQQTNENSQIDVISAIVDERRSKTPAAELPTPTTLVVHLRIGDVIDFRDITVDQILKGTKNTYAKPLKYYEAVLTELDNSVSQVVLIGGFHYDTKKGKKLKSLQYVKSISNFFVDHGFKVTSRIRENERADEDFVFMSSAAYFVPSGGGFSELLKAIVAHRGGHVLPKSELDKKSGANVPSSKTRRRAPRILHISTSLSEFESGSRGTVRGESRLATKTLPVAAHCVLTMVESSLDVDVHFVFGYNVSASNSELIHGTLTRAGAQRVTWTEFVIPFVPNKKKPGEMIRLESALSREHRFVVLERMNDGYEIFSSWEDDMVVTGAHVRNFMEKSLLLESVEKRVSASDVATMMMPGFIRVEVATVSSETRLFGTTEDRQPVPSTCQNHPELAQAINPDICCSMNANRSVSSVVLWEAALASFRLIKLPAPVAQVVGLLPVAGQSIASKAVQSSLTPSYSFPNLSKRDSNSLFSQQAGWMATQQQLRRLEDQCEGKFLPPFAFDSDNFSTEFWSGGFQLFGGKFCRVQRVVFLEGGDFSYHLLYHYSDNKQRTRPPFHFSRAVDLQAQLAQHACSGKEDAVA